MTMLPTNILHVMSDDQLDKLIQKAIQEGFEKGQKRTIEKPLTKQEAANYLRISLSTLDERFRSQALPTSLRHYNGGTIYFFASELEAFIKKS
jgi:hypothetical protein